MKRALQLLYIPAGLAALTLLLLALTGTNSAAKGSGADAFHRSDGGIGAL